MRSEPIVLFTSCDENYFKYVPTLLMSVHEYMSAHSIEFYLLHTSDKPEKVRKLQRFSNKLGIRFQGVQIKGKDLEQFNIIRRLSSVDLHWPAETYFPLLPNLYLPPHVDRALKLETGDMILSGDISEFYFSDFKGNILTVSKGFAERWDYTAEDLYDRSKYLQLALEYFNSGSILFDVALMRRLNINFEYYIDVLKSMKNIHGGYYWEGEQFGFSRSLCVTHAEQGVYGIAFAGYINFFDAMNLGNINTPYNFRPFVIECYKQKIPNVTQLSLENLQPKMIHLLGNKPGTPPEKRKTLLKISQQCLQLWDHFEQGSQKIMEGLE